jgi:hypothetical protein
MEEEIRPLIFDPEHYAEDSLLEEISDTDRLYWLLRHIRGNELNRMGLMMNWTGDLDEFRQRIDKQILNK